MFDQIENGTIKAAVRTAGAELVSLQSSADRFEYLWQDNEGGCAGHSPLLFPIVGSLPDDRYTYQEKSYEMGLHGFAALLQFTAVERKPERVFYEARYNEATLEQYPFKFDLGIGYTLQGNTIGVKFAVSNLDTDFMLFSIGAHPFFQCPFYPGESMDDYLLLFETAETVQRRIKGDILLTGSAEPLLNSAREVRLSHELFARGAIILEGLQSRWVELRSPNHQKSIRVDFTGFPYLGIWSFGNSPFVCIEPWHGIDSTVDDPHDFTLKEGLIRLKPGGCFTCEYGITVE